MEPQTQSPIHVYVDVDDTIVRSVGTKRIAIPSVVRHVLDLHAQGAVLYCWSAGGADYARASADEFGLGHCFSAFLSKPNVIIDDQKPADWPRCYMIHPCNIHEQSIDAYRAQLK
jgi:hypothetical protein